jgi:hypothetical protein
MPGILRAVDLRFGDLPAWVAAIGTVGALAAAFRQIATERALRQRAEREAIDMAERSQAELVSAWYGGHDELTEGGAGQDWLVLLNRSNEPVYQAVASVVFIQGAAPERGEEYRRLRGEDERYFLDQQPTLGVIPPGRWRVHVPGGWGGMMRQPGAEIAFSDRGGRHWVRRATGELKRLPTNAFDHYGLHPPFSLGPPEPY